MHDKMYIGSADKILLALCSYNLFVHTSKLFETSARVEVFYNIIRKRRNDGGHAPQAYAIHAVQVFEKRYGG